MWRCAEVEMEGLYHRGTVVLVLQSQLGEWKARL